ncbi:MAG: hypothetical protein E7376_02595 [Clostridiales bacterium]|nr:hypothetical protein [Clostridiales bacterium]
MKKNIKWLINIAAICLCICAMAIGVYAAKQASLSTKGTITFTAVGCDLEITGTLSGYATDIYATTTSSKELSKVTLEEANSYTGAVDIGEVYFSEFAAEEPQIVMTLNIKNNSKFVVSGIVTVPDTIANGNIKIEKNTDKVNMAAETGRSTVVITFTLVNLEENVEINLSELSDLNIKFDKSTEHLEMELYKEDGLLWLEAGTYPTEVAEGETDIYGDYKGKPIRWFAFAKVNGTVDESTGIFTKTEVLETLSGKKGSASTDTCDVLNLDNISGNYYFISEFVLMQSAMGDNYNTIDKDGDGEGNALAPANDYQYSEIRKYIDGDMLTKFSMKNIVDVYATQRVLESEAGYMYNSASGMYDSVTIMENCTSKMWILSETESYFLPEGNLAASTGGTRGTTYPKAVSTGYWWLRSQGQLSSSTYKYVDTSGSLNWNNLTCMYGLRTAFQYTIAEGTI